MQEALMHHQLSQTPGLRVRSLAARFATFLVSLALMGTAAAQLQVSENITSSQRWQIADSPVRVTGDVRIENSAILSIDPGVRVELGSGASMTVRSGGLYAVGTPSSKIVFTGTKVPAQAQPGDWGQLRFEGGTLDSSTALDHVVVEYGSGVALQAASPTLRNLAIRFQAGPAIVMDTASSPIGEGLSATGNALNGIQVAEGTISGDAVWGLRGIPYVVPSGTIAVGDPGFALSPQRLQVVQGVNAYVRLSLPSAAPSGGLVVTMASSVPSSVSVPATVAFSEGETEKLVNLSSLAPGAATLTASRAGFDAATAHVEVVARPALGLAGNVSVDVGGTAPVTLTLSERAPDAGLLVALTNSNPSAVSVPAQIQVPGRARSVNIEARGIASGTSRLEASAPGWQAAAADVFSRGRTLFLPSSLVVAPGTSRNVTVSVSQVIQSQPLSISLAASVPGAVEVPAAVEIPVGATSATFTLRGLVQGSLQVTATATGFETATTSVLVEALALFWEAPFIYDSTPSGIAMYLPAQLQTSARLRLSHPAPVGGLRVRLRAADPASVTFPVAEVVIPEGSYWLDGYVRMTGLAQGITQIIAESDDVTSALRDARVGPPATVRWWSGDGEISLGRGMSGRPTIVLESGGRSVGLLEPVTVTIESADAQKVATETSVAVSTVGSFNAGPLITGREVTTTPVALRARLGADGPEAVVGVSVVPPQLSIFGLEDLRAVAASRDDFRVGLSVAAPNAIPQWAADPLVAQVSVVDAAPGNVVDGIHSQSFNSSLIGQIDLRAGSASSDLAYVGAASTEGSYRIRAVVAGVGSVDSDLQQVATPSLRFSQATATVAVGMRTFPYRIAIERRVGSQGTSSATPITVRLENPDPSTVSVPAEVIIPAYQNAAYFEIEGLVASATEVAIRAVADGHQSVDPIRIRVVAPTLRLNGLDGQRTLGADRDMFSVEIFADAPDAIPAAVTSNQSIALSLVDTSPSDVVAGFFAASSGGSSMSSVTMPAGMSTVWIYVGEGQRGGSYRVRAEATGMQSATSDLQRISSTELVFSHSVVRVGRGLEVQYHLYIERRQNGVLVNSPSAQTVTLSNARPDAVGLPPTVTINANSSRAQITIRGLALAEAIQIGASADGMDGPANASISVVEPELRIGGLDESRGLSSESDYFNVYVSGAGVGWAGYQTAIQTIDVALAIVDADPVNVVPGLFADQDATTPTAITSIPAGEMYAAGAYVGRPTSLGRYRIRASAPGYAESVSEEQLIIQERIAFGSDVRNLGIKLENSFYFDFRLPDGNASYNAEDVVVSLECVDDSICEVEESVVVPPGCSSECSSGASVAVRGLAEGTTQLRATAPGYTDGVLVIHVVKPEVRFVDLTNYVAADEDPPSFWLQLVVPEVPGSESGDEYQTPFDVIEVDVVSSHPDALDVETPVVPGKLRVGPELYDQAVLVLPEPRVPVEATITASGSGVRSTSQNVTVE